MSKSIRISEKYGVNPTLPICFWCGEETGEIALLGKLKGDKEAPKNMILNYEPCPKCAENFKKGVLVIEATRTPNNEGQPPLLKEPEEVYPTGKYVVVKEESFNRIFNFERKAGQKCLMEPEVFNQVFPPEITDLMGDKEEK